MGKTRNTGKLATQIQFDNSNNLVIGTSASSSFNTSGSVNAIGGITGSIFGIGNPTSFSSSISSDLNSIHDVTTSNISRLNSIEEKTGSFATTGSNSFYGTQVFSGSVFIASDLVVQGSSSIQYISASSVSIGTNIVQLNTATPSVRYAGVSVQDSGSSAGVTGSILWDSLCNRWIYSNPSTIGYSGGMLMSGPRTSTLGTESPLTCNYIAKSGGGDHLYDSCIYESSGSVGIGTTIIDCYTGYSVLQVQGNSGAIIQTSDGSVKTALVSNSTGFGIVGTRTNHGLKIYTNDIERMLITNCGNVGIGVTPATTSGVTELALGSSNTNPLISGIRDGVNAFALSSDSGGTLLNERRNLDLRFNNNNTERMRITNCGNVGIGICCADRRLTINSGASEGSLGLTSNNGVEIDMVGFGTGFTHPQTRIKLIDGGVFGGNLTFWTKPNGSQTNALVERARITTDGQLLINATGSAYSSNQFGYNLGVRGNSNQTFISIARSTETLDTQGMIVGLDSGAGYFLMNNNMPILFGTNGTERLRISNTGIACFSCQVCAPSGVRFGNGSSTINYYCSADWAPQFYAGGSTSFGLGSQTGTGKFTRIGNVVTLHGQIAWTGGGSGGASLLSIQNLPFPATSNARGAVGPGIISGISSIASGGLNMIVEIGTCIIYFTTNCGNGGPHIHLTGDAVTSGGSRLFSFGGSYITNDPS
jgi:hypothetical protein